MSDRMRPIPFPVLLDAIVQEHAATGSFFGVYTGFRGTPGKTLPLFGEAMETPFGPAAGPHTQLAQNIIAAYVGGARFFELKTVQTLDGENLPVAKPCILAAEEGYNVEWSTELTVGDALNEYVKAWYALKLLAKEFGLGGENGFIFNMSVGYDLAGISSPKIDCFIEGLKNAEALPIWAECRAATEGMLSRFHNVNAAYLDGISPRVCTSITLSTLHGCPPDEIERIATYLLGHKGLHTFVKCNPTLLGYDFARKTLDEMGYDRISFDRHHFEADLQFDDAVPMLRRLLALAAQRGLTFGVKLTNTFPVDIKRGELPGDEMYLSGKALYPLTLAVAERLTRAFAGALRISYSGGADAFNIARIFSMGIWPITVATTLLKPGGYARLGQMARALSALPYGLFTGVDLPKLSALLTAALTDPHHTTPLKSAPSHKLSAKVPLLDCFTAPCKGGCPIGQDIPEYLRLLGEGNAPAALRVILEKNPLPNITGTICTHHCGDKCMRGYYESAVAIRSAKLEATQAGWAEVLPTLTPEHSRPDICAAIVGGGPAGMAAAFFLARGGAQVTLFEQRSELGGIVRQVIPAFRIPNGAIEADGALLDQLGVHIKLSTVAPTAEALLAQGHTHVVLSPGAWTPGVLAMEGTPALNVLAFLDACKHSPALIRTRKHVVVIGGGNTAMDAARAALRLSGTETATIAYRRTVREMPADQEELTAALADGAIFRPLLAPVAWDGETLTCAVLTLGAPDASGRRAPEKTGATVTLPADLVVAAVGDKPDGAFLTENGVTVDFGDNPLVNSATLETGTRKVYLAGDARRGPATVVEAIADAATIAADILGPRQGKPLPVGRRGTAMARHGILRDEACGTQECDRCLECLTLCECCVEVCPNRANVAIQVPTRRQPQILHLDSVCNECGNCATFCPYDSAPYLDKFTVFSSVPAFLESSNNGFVTLNHREHMVRVRLDGLVLDTSLQDEDSPLPSGIHELMETIFLEYSYLLG